jgi:transposase
MRKVALDVHKRTIYVLIYDGDREVLRRRFGTNAAGEAALLAAIQPGDRVVLEATTGVFRLANRLESVGATVYVLDPQQTRAVGLRGKKTDYRDCVALLEYLDRAKMPVVWRPDLRTREIRQLTRERFAFNQSIVRLKNRVRGLLHDEGLQPPSAPWEPAGREWLDAQPLGAVARRIVERELAVIAVDEAMKAQEDADLAQFALGSLEAQRLMQLEGFGATLAVMWIGEVGGVERFPSSKHLVSYAGLNPRLDQSGDCRRHGGITKAGRSQLRWIMVEVAWRHVHNEGPEAEYYHRLLKRGKLPQVAIVALARRLLVLAYFLLKRQETHRQLAMHTYAAKLTRLAAHRPARVTAEPCDRDWAADRVEAITGQVAPRRAAGVPRRNRPRRTPQGEGARPDLSGRRQTRGSASEVPADQHTPPELAANADPERHGRRTRALCKDPTHGDEKNAGSGKRGP